MYEWVGVFFQSKKEGKDQESKQSSTTHDRLYECGRYQNTGSDIRTIITCCEIKLIDDTKTAFTYAKHGEICKKYKYSVQICRIL